MNRALKATHSGVLRIDDVELNVAVLEDSTRVITHSAVFKALGREARGNSRVINIPAFMDAKNLQPLISSELFEVIKKIDYLDINGKRQSGFNANILPLTSDLYLKARERGLLKSNQLEVAHKAEILVRSLAKVGITALVDEATGYQYDREKDELQKILKAYISEELLPWQKKFPDEYYKELFRLNGWQFDIKGIKKRPGVIGTWTNTLIYDELPPGVKDELKAKTPISQKGNKTARYHQFLTEDIGDQHLKSQIDQILMLFRLSNNMEDMWHKFGIAKERKNGQLDLPFDFNSKGYTIEPIEKSTELSSFNNKLKQALDFNPNKESREKGRQEKLFD